MRRIATRAIITKGNKLLLVMLKPYKNEPNDYYCTIGGTLDEGEDLIGGLKREVMEETGVEAEVGALLCVQQYSGKQDTLEFFFHVTNGNDFENLDLSKSTHGEGEIEDIGFFDPKSVKTLPKFLDEIDINEVIESKDIKIFNYL